MQIKKLASGLKLVSSDNLQDILTGMGITPDFESSDAVLRYIHRKADDADIYFISNQQGKPVSTECTFRVAGKQPELWDPVSGQMRDAIAFRETTDGRTTVPLELSARGSIFVVFRKALASGCLIAKTNFLKLSVVSRVI